MRTRSRYPGYYCSAASWIARYDRRCGRRSLACGVGGSAWVASRRSRALTALVIAERERNARLDQIIKELQRHRFGHRAETLPKIRCCWPSERSNRKRLRLPTWQLRPSPRDRHLRAGRMRVAASVLPRIEVTINIDGKACPCCAGMLRRIVKTWGERLDIVPARFRVLVSTQMCLPASGGGSGEADRGRLAKEATVPHVRFDNYADHLTASGPGRDDRTWAALIRRLSPTSTRPTGGPSVPRRI